VRANILIPSFVLNPCVEAIWGDFAREILIVKDQQGPRFSDTKVRRKLGLFFFCNHHHFYNNYTGVAPSWEPLYYVSAIMYYGTLSLKPDVLDIYRFSFTEIIS